MATVYQQHKPLKKLIRVIWAVFSLFLGTVSLYIFTVQINLWNLYGALPSLAVLENPESDLASELYAADGVLLGKYFRNNRSPVAYEEISQKTFLKLGAKGTRDYSATYRCLERSS